ncbi:MAG: ribonuclease D [Pseudomonadota bacterium]
MNWTLVTDQAGMLAALKDIAGADAVAVDTEFMRRNTFYPQPALLQLNATGHAWLVDPLAIKDLDPLREWMSNSESIKLLHSCSEDMEVFRHWLGVVPKPLVDTQRIAPLVGEPAGLGYRAIVERLSGVEIDKGETRSDWLKRPLTESQCHYAALDVLELLPVWKVLLERAEGLGRRDWLLRDADDFFSGQEERDREPFRRVKGAGRLSRRSLEALKQLWEWRESRARNADRPRGWVLDDKACIAVAMAMPTHAGALAELDVLPPAVLRKQGERLLEVVQAAREISECDLPAAAPRPLGGPQRDQLKSAKSQLKVIGESLEIAPEALMAGADLELLVREASGEEVSTPSRWTNWRQEFVVDPLRTHLGAAS